MTSTSTIPVVLDALEDLFSGAFGQDFQVTQGQSKSTDRERLIIANVESAPQEWETLGGLVHRNEQYEVRCGIVVDDPQHLTFRDTKNRAFELLATAEEAIRVNDALGLVSRYAYFECDFGGVTAAHGGPTDEGWNYEIVFSVRVEATI